MTSSPRNKSLIIATCAILVACLLPIFSYFVSGNFLDSLELDSFDWRMRQAVKSGTPPADNLAAVYIDENTVAYLGTNYALDFPYPRSVHARLIRELSAEGAKGVAFDILFKNRRYSDPQHFPVDGGSPVSSDEFFAEQIAAAGNVILAAGKESSPAPLFETNTSAVAHISTKKDHDGVLRRVQPFVIDPENPDERRWHMGIVLAAKELGLDLETPEFLGNGLRLHSASGSTVTVPLDRHGDVIVDWNISWNDDRILTMRYDAVIEADIERQFRELDDTNEPPPPDDAKENQFMNRLVVVGSLAEGNNVTDLGATPVSVETPLVITHLNVANMVLKNRFITQPGLTFELFLVLLLSSLASLITFKTRPAHAGLWILCIAAGMAAVALLLFVHLKIWLPVVTPIAGGLLLPYISLVTFRLVFEETEQKRVKNVFKSIVSPNVVNELLSTETLSLGGARRHITVFFADIRGFTQMTDSKQSKAEQFARENQLSREDAEAHFDKSSSEVLATVNSYLALIADVIKKHDGTLDKYIGDCVMAFWGAPTPNEKHAVSCVRAAVDAQRAIYNFNQERFKENERIKASGEDTVLLDLLTLGTGINSGMTTVGLMGSREHISNYTVFGGDVNLASRLEGLSGRSRIFIGESTFLELQKHDRALAATCVKQPPTTVKGIQTPISHYEVPWRESDAAPGKSVS
jgi:adenylate cyclase